MSEGPKLEHALTIAERGLSDLQAYVPATRQALGFGDISITLKGATQ